MKSTIDATAGILMIVLVGSTAITIYRKVQTETVLKVQHGLPPLERFTQKLTGTRLDH